MAEFGSLSVFTEFPVTTVEEFIYVHRAKDSTRNNFCTSDTLLLTVKNEINLKSFASPVEASGKEFEKHRVLTADMYR